jgi:hypothetical protein
VTVRTSSASKDRIGMGLSGGCSPTSRQNLLTTRRAEPVRVNTPGARRHAKSAFESVAASLTAACRSASTRPGFRYTPLGGSGHLYLFCTLTDVQNNFQTLGTHTLDKEWKL